jgi:hypothetical protein
MSGAQAAAVVSGCCCVENDTKSPPDPDGCPQIGWNGLGRIPADSTLDTLNVSFSLTDFIVGTNVGNTEPFGNCNPSIGEETYSEEAQVTGTGGQVTWNGVDWQGGSEGSATVTAIRHATVTANCADTCWCQGGPPCPNAKPCCGGTYLYPREWRGLKAGGVQYTDQDVFANQETPCPPCCLNNAFVNVGVSGVNFCGPCGVKVAYSCFPIGESFGLERCNCPGLPKNIPYGYVVYGRVAIRSQAAGMCVGNTAGFLNLPSSATYLWRAGVWVKPCCGENDSVKGTYRLAIPTASSGAAGFPQFSWLTTRSGTATVS